MRNAMLRVMVTAAMLAVTGDGIALDVKAHQLESMFDKIRAKAAR